MNSYSYTSSYVSNTGTGSDSYSWTPNSSITTLELPWAKLNFTSTSTPTETLRPLYPFEACFFSSLSKVISRFEDTPCRKLTDISEILNNKWVTPKEPICEVSFEKPVRASEFFEFVDMNLKYNKLILDDEELTFKYYMNLIDDFLNNYMVLKSYPSTKIKDLDSKFYLRSVPSEYKGLNVLVYPMEGVYYICEYKDLGRTKKMLQEEVEKCELFPPEHYWGTLPEYS